MTLVGQIFLPDNSHGEFVPIDVAKRAKFYRVFALPQTDQRLKIPKVLKISGNFSEFLHVRQYYKSQSLSEKQLNLYQVLTFFLNHTFKVFIYKACVGIQTLMLPASFCLSVLVYFKTVKSS